MKIGVLGSGDVAKVLGSGFLKHGHDVMMGTRTPPKLADWAKQNPRGSTGRFSDAARFAELLVLAVKGTVVLDALRAAGAANLTGKVVIDATNPIADAPPVNGVLKFFTKLDESLVTTPPGERGGFLEHACLSPTTFRSPGPVRASQRAPGGSGWVFAAGVSRRPRLSG
jgi:hypothetical protein